MTRLVTVAAVQMAMVDDLDTNVATAERLVRDAAAQGAQIVLIPELFEGPYFCIDQLPEHFARARSLDDHPTIEQFRAVAAELDLVLPLSVYERAGQATFNTVVVVDAGRRRARQRTARATSPTGRATPRSTTSTRATPASGCGPPATRRSAWASAGTSGSPSPHGAWRCSAPRCCSTRRRSAASRPTRRGIPAATGSG